MQGLLCYVLPLSFVPQKKNPYFFIPLITWIHLSLILWWYANAAPGISASPSEANMRYFDVMIFGPTQSPYDGNIEFNSMIMLPWNA